MTPFEGFKLDWFLSVVAIPFAWWILNQILTTKKEVENVKDELQNHKVYAAENYARKDEFSQLRKEIREDFTNVNQKLDKISERIGK